MELHQRVLRPEVSVWLKIYRLPDTILEHSLAEVMLKDMTASAALLHIVNNGMGFTIDKPTTER